MALIEWKENLATGVDEIDSDHRELVGLMNEMHEALQAGRDAIVLTRILERMIFHCTEHFSREEKLFAGSGYPGAYQHGKEHDEMVLWAMGFRQRFAEGVTAPEVLEALTSLKDSFLEHISH